MSDAPASPQKKKRRWWWLWLLLVLFVVVPAVLVGGAFIFLSTDAGQKLLRAQVLNVVNETIVGRVEADGVKLEGGHLVLRGVKLYTPEGELVASIDVVDAYVDLPSLAGQVVKITSVNIGKPELFLKQDERGLNLLRAVAMKKPSPDDPNAPPNPWRVEVDALSLTDGAVDFVSGDQRITTNNLTLTGDVKVKLADLAIDGDLTLDSRVTAPLDEELHVKLGATTHGPQAFDLFASLGGTRLKGGLALPTMTLTIDDLVATPRELTAFVPSYPVKTDVRAKGKLSLEQAALTVEAGKARVVLDGRYDLDRNAADAFALKATGIDLQELIGAELPSDLALDASGKLSDWRPETLTGEVKVDGTWKDGGYQLAAVTAEATANNGDITITRGDVTSPGLALRTRGSISPTKLDLAGTLTAKELKQTDTTLKRFAKVDVGLAGKGALDVTVKGPLKGPAIKALGKLHGLRVATVAIDELDIDADVPDVSKPLDTDIKLHAKHARVGDREFDEVVFDFYTHGRAFDLDISTKGLGDVTLHLIGKLDADNQGATLDTARLEATNAKWAIEAPTHLSWRDGVVVDELSLVDGDQRLTAHATWTKKKVDAALDARNLNLARLPTVLAPTSLGLAGRVDVNALAGGTQKQPSLSLDATISGGEVMDLSGLNVTLVGAWKDERAVGTLKASTPLGALDGTFDLPVLALLDEKPSPATAHFTIDRVPLSQLEEKLKQKLPASGQLSAVLDLSGSADAPKLDLVVSSPELQVELDDAGTKLTLRDAKVRAFTDEQGKLDATVDANALGGQHRLTLDTPLTLSSLRKSPPDKDALLDLDIKLGVRLVGVSLKALHEEKVVRDDELAGTASLAGELTGKVRAPQGELTLKLVGVTSPPVRDVTSTLTLAAEAQRVTLKGNAALAGRPTLEVDVNWGAAVAQVITALLQPKGADDALLSLLQSTPLKGLVVLSPLPLEKALTLKDDATPPKGTVTATLDVTGTLEALNARLTGGLNDLSFDKVALGSARFDVKVQSREQTATVVLGGLGRDDLKLKGTTGLDLRLSQLKDGFEWKTAPVTAALEARTFDLGFLSGSVELLRVVAGKLSMKADVTGTLGAPKFIGDAKLENGRLALAGYGDYRDLQLDLHVTNELVDLKKLEAVSGAGNASLVARGEKLPTGTWRVTSEGQTKKFPIVTDDQLMAIASLKYSLRGNVSSAFADITELALPDVTVELPEVKRKDLQDLQRPKDIVVLRSGERFTMRRKKQLQKDNATPDEAGFGLRAVIAAPRNLWVKSSDVNIELGLSDGFAVEYQNDLRLRGDARIVRGTLSVIGREFTIQKNSEARFAGPATQPYVNVSALHVNTREQVKITVTVIGKGTDIAIKPTSEPAMPESDIYAILATGRRTLRQGGGNTITPGQAASVVGQLAASQLKTVIAKKLPLDVLNFETSDELRNVKLDVGWYLNDDLYLGGTMNIGANRERGESVWGGRLEYQMTRTLSLEAAAGDAPSYAGDVVFARDF